MDKNEVKQIRHALGLSQRAFAKAVGCSPASVVNWETVGRAPLPVYEKKIRELYDGRKKQA